MAELLPPDNSMGGSSSNNSSPYPHSSSFRFHGFLNQPDDQDPLNIPYPVELEESDVVWSSSFAAVASSDSKSSSSSPSPPSNHHHVFQRPLQRFNPTTSRSGLSLALSEEDGHQLIKRKSTLNPSKTTIPQSKFHQSAPVNIPVWPKEFRRYAADADLDVPDEEDEEMMPPHLIVAKSHVTFSVFEGVGRTLKGRDLRRVRNAVFQSTGFMD